MSIWFISDTHFGHKNIIKYSNRPYVSVEEMNESLIQNWNKCVKPTDDIYHLGDFAFLNQASLEENVLENLDGNIHLILGNHDQEISRRKDELVDLGYFYSIQRYTEIKYNKKLFCLFHYGQRVWNQSHRGSIHLYGHSHGTLPPHGLSVDVGVDCKEITDEYRPIHIDEIMTYMSKREPQLIDHHGNR